MSGEESGEAGARMRGNRQLSAPPLAQLITLSSERIAAGEYIQSRDADVDGACVVSIRDPFRDISF
jgi:hypothetical protein